MIDPAASPPAEIQFIPTVCAICGTPENSQEIYPANFSIEHLSEEIFSARRVPDKIHYRIVKCTVCGLIRSDPIVDAHTLARLYAHSKQTYDSELDNLMASYVRYLARLDRYGVSKGSLLEIGCGSGFFLEKALEHGYDEVIGVEPSQDAVSKSKAHIRPHILCDMLRPGLLPKNRLDAICMFQVFDHISAPLELLAECFDALKPGGLVLCLNHDAAALSARLLGENSPIIDIEHTYLYTQDTIQKIFAQAGFVNLETGPALNTYSIRYLAQLAPFPKPFKNSLMAWLHRHAIGKTRMTVKLGNLYLIAQKPRGA